MTLSKNAHFPTSSPEKRVGYRIRVLMIGSVGRYSILVACPLSKLCKLTLFGSEEDRALIKLMTPDPSFSLLTNPLDLKFRSNVLWRVSIGPAISFLIYAVRILVEKYDIVHVQSCPPYFFLLVPLLRTKRVRIAWTVHDVYLRPSSYGLRGTLEVFLGRILFNESYVKRHTDVFFVHGRKLAAFLQGKRVSKTKIVTLNHPSYPYLRKLCPSKGTKNKPYFLFFGHLRPYKGIPLLLDAVSILRRRFPNIRLVIAGEGRYDVKAETEKRLLENNVLILKQFTAEQDIGALFCDAIAVILPYQDGSQSGVIPLAYTFGKPVIASRVGSLSEMVDEQKTGFTFDPNNAVELARSMSYFLEDEQLSERMRVFCSKKSETSLSPSLIAAKICEAYRQIRETE